MPWIKTKPPVINNHTLRAQKLDRKAERLFEAHKRRGYRDPSLLVRSVELREKADRIAAKGGWF